MIRRALAGLCEIGLYPLRTLSVRRPDPEIEAILRDAAKHARDAKTIREMFIANGVAPEQIDRIDVVGQRWLEFANQYRHLTDRYERDG